MNSFIRGVAVCLLFLSSESWARSSICTDNGLATLTIHLPVMKIQTDLCAVDAKKLPADVVQLIKDLGRIHHSIAKTIGQSFEQTVGGGFNIAFNASTTGSISSYALRDGSGVIMTMFADSPINEWSSQTYAHELMHVLSYRPGPFADALAGLIDHPFITEALPDLISIDLHNQTVVKFESGLAPCLINRDATPTRSLAQTFGDFYTFSASDKLSGCCASLTPEQKTPHALGICQAVKEQSSEGYYEGMQALGATVRRPTASDLHTRFRFDQCLFQINGWDVLQNCGTHSFAEPLSSFFMAMRKAVGRSLVPDWIQVLKNQSKELTQYRCAYQKPEAPKASTVITLRGVAPSFKKLREKLNPKEQAIFDRIWREHDFDQLSDLDTLFLNHSARTFSLAPLSVLNKDYSNAHRCGSPYAIDSVACDVTCTLN